MNKFYSFVCFMFWVGVQFQWENWAINLCSSSVGFRSEIRIVPPCSPTPMSLQKWSRDYSDLIFARLFSTLRTGHLDCEPLNPRFYKIYFFTRNNMLPTHFWENSLPSPGWQKLYDDVNVTDVGCLYTDCITWYFLHLRNNHKTSYKIPVDNKKQKKTMAYFTL